MGKCLLRMTPETSDGRCFVGECRFKRCGWDSDEAARRSAYIRTHGLTLCEDGLYRLKMTERADAECFQNTK